MTILLFLLVLGVLVLVHEWGHYIVAKLTGMRVDEFAIGFPPKVLSVTRGETKYKLNLLPIGGYVKIYGENLDEAERIGENSVDVSRSFSGRPRWAQALVLLAGVVMNIIFAWFLFVVTLMIGVPTAVDETIATENAQLIVTETLPDSPAAVLPGGAEVLAVSTTETTLDALHPQAFSDFVRATAPEPLAVEYVLNGQTETAYLVPEQGIDTADEERYIVGVSLALVETKQAPFFEAIVSGTRMTIDVFINIATGLFSLIGQSIAGTADYSQIAGPVGIVNLVGDAAAFGLAALLTFTAVISLNLAVINLLPVPALDGGRLVFVAIEAITGKHIPAKWAGYINLAGFVFLMLLMLLVTYNDILRLL